jgi:diacylglycerol kinase (ATP)
MSNGKLFSVKRLVKAGGYSWCGLTFAWRNETAFQQESVALLVMLPLALWLPETRVGSALLVMSLVVVLITELINTAVEAAIDRHGDELHHWSAVAKDVASAAVLLAMIQCALVWLLVLI